MAHFVSNAAMWGAWLVFLVPIGWTCVQASRETRS
jgi:hypothetical protein